MIVVRCLVAVVAAVLFASLICSPFAMWAQGGAPITRASTVEVVQLSLALGVIVTLFVGTLAALAAAIAWAVDDRG